MIFSSAPIDTSLAAVRGPNPRMAASNLSVRRRNIAAKYELADTNSENRRLWANADPLSADGAANPNVRRTLRNRSRLVHRNNSYFRGMTSTIGIEIVGPGPQLQIMPSPDDEDNDDETAAEENDKAASEEENSFAAWMRRERIPEKLRAIVECEDVSGEVFIVQAKTPSGDLTYLIYEPDHVQGNGLTQPSENYYDGIHYDQYGQPVAYDITWNHPGDNGIGVLNPDDYRKVPAELVYHYFTASRPGQRRGVPTFTPALELLEERRRHRHAVLAASETAASFAAVVEQDISLVGFTETDDGTRGEPVPNESSEAGEELPVNHRVLTTLPPGHTVKQIDTKQPTTGFSDFDRACLQEAARCANMPYILAALSSAGSNLAGAYLDFQLWRKAVAVRRDKLGDLLDWMRATWRKWYLYGDEPLAAGATHTWRWPELGEHADPSKVASATAANLDSGATTYAEVYAKRGLDWEKMERQRAKELGLTVKELRRRRADKLYPPAGAQGNQPVPPKGNEKPEEPPEETPENPEEENDDGEESDE